MPRKKSLDDLQVASADRRSAREASAKRRLVRKDAPPLRPKALTVKLTEADYKRLRKFAFDHNQTHQGVIEAALIEYLDAHK